MNILSWNICWNFKNKSLSNIINTITKSSYDFIALQEAIDWEIIYKGLNNKNMGIVHHYFLNKNNAKVELVTFYNYIKYKIIAIKIGNIMHKNDIRPYHIIFCKNRITKQFYIFINLHNGHNVTIDYLQNKLSQNLNKLIIVKNNRKKDFININLNYETEFNICSLFNDINKIKVIVVGDFNDFGINNYWKGLQPFKNSNLIHLKNILVDTRGYKPPNTYFLLNNISDYILTSHNIHYEDYTKQNYIPKEVILPSSDHFPIKSICEDN